MIPMLVLGGFWLAFGVDRVAGRWLVALAAGASVAWAFVVDGHPVAAMVLAALNILVGFGAGTAGRLVLRAAFPARR
ncbi:MAG: hypothetical protein HKN26_06430 [Acidimicrobiales bacterium]|nr:hypothetical protein [Acidimicrobiales bacterium]